MRLSVDLRKIKLTAFMNKIFFLFLLVYFFVMDLPAQPRQSFSDKAIKTITDFRERENKRDSVLNHPLGSNAEEDFFRRYQFYDSIYKVLKTGDTAASNFTEQINVELLKYDVEDELSAWQYKSYLNPILADEGFHTNLAAMGSQVMSTKKEFENYIQRLKDIPRYVDEHLVLMRKGLELGISQPRAILNGYENTYQQHIVSDVTKSVFYKPFLQKPFAISDDDWKKISEEGKNAVQQYAIEGFKKIKTFFDKEYLLKTRTTIGVSNFPDGLAYYQERVRHYTTTDLTYEEVYQLGLSEVARIKKEMMEVMKEAKFNGTLQQFIQYLRTNPKFYATTPEQLLKEASYIAKKADGMLPQFFGKLPRQPYGVEPVPAHLAPTYTAGRYSGAPINSKRAGHYWVNTYDLKSRPLYALEALTMHEAVPGHHLQIALTQELDSLPAFRRNLYVNTFGEGWGVVLRIPWNRNGFLQRPLFSFRKIDV